MPGPNGESCGECYYWERDPDAKTSGFCFRFPPVQINDAETTVFNDNWCGEFKPLETKP